MSRNSLPKILIAAGGSGGHLFPAMSLASQLAKNCEIAFAGHKLENSSFFNQKIPFWDISARAPKRGNFFRFFLETAKGFFQSVRILRNYSPDVVIGFGSFHSFPVLLASLILRKKIVLFEANCILGKVNRFFSLFAKKIAIQFPLAKPLPKAFFVPLLPWGTPENKTLPTKEEALAYFGLERKKTILVFGGSQGAAFLNEAMPQAIPLLNDPDLQVIHFTGKKWAVYNGVAAVVKEFEKRMDLAYAAADIVVCRSGAGTIAELIRYQKPSLLIPYPTAADDHQWENGKFLAYTVRGAKLLRQSEADPKKIAFEIKALFSEIDAKKNALQKWQEGERICFAKAVIEEIANGK